MKGGVHSSTDRAAGRGLFRSVAVCTADFRAASLRLRAATSGGAYCHVSTSDLVLDAPFVSGTLSTWLFAADLAEQRDCPDALDAGQAITWCDATQAPDSTIERDDAGGFLGTVRDAMTTLTTVSLSVPMDDSWFDDAYDRLEQVCEARPPVEDDCRVKHRARHGSRSCGAAVRCCWPARAMGVPAGMGTATPTTSHSVTGESARRRHTSAFCRSGCGLWTSWPVHGDLYGLWPGFHA